VKILTQQVCDKKSSKVLADLSSELILEHLDINKEIDVMEKMKQNWIEHYKNQEDVVIEGQ
jgi:K+-sensing histidine kinase KdpD